MNEMKSIINWEDVKGKIFLRLVNYEKNKADLERKIHVKFLDLAILVHCDCKERNLDGFYVSKKQALIWNKSIKDIYQAALENTYSKNNTLVTPIINLLPQETAYVVQDAMDIINTEKVMMILTNKSVSFGAAMLLNISELKKLADQFDSNLYLLPSSVHEILAICSDQNTDVSYLTDMVNGVNNNVVRPEDYLSDHVYYFDREKCEVTMAVPA